ncbi:AbfB domain-containing protein [Actinoplanes sp. NPDC051494]|uniref:AbfB domain-containing protein n=1 Tax=Actinoplanes sp. NPDC051494 TaxID=3363907 RepID=UPI003791AA31
MSPQDGIPRDGEWVPPAQYFPPTPPKPTVYTSPARAMRVRRRTRAVYVGGGLAALLLAVSAGIALAPRAEKPATLFVPKDPIPLAPVASATQESATDAPAGPGTRNTPHSTVRPHGAATTRPVTDPVASGSPAASSAPSAAPSVPAPLLVVGATIGLALAGDPGVRVRSDDFRARILALNARSPARERAESRFVVRAGAADARCVSFESDSYRGRFLRHRDYELYLDTSESSALFAADTTFCPVEAAGGTVVLRSHNYPDRYLTRRDSLLSLTSVATSFTVQSPL